MLAAAHLLISTATVITHLQSIVRRTSVSVITNVGGSGKKMEEMEGDGEVHITLSFTICYL